MGEFYLFLLVFLLFCIEIEFFVLKLRYFFLFRAPNGVSYAHGHKMKLVISLRKE